MKIIKVTHYKEDTSEELIRDIKRLADILVCKYLERNM